MSLNALVNACNQKSSRDPVVEYGEATVEAALEALIEKDLVNKSTVSRVPKFEERLSAIRNFVPREIAVLCLLMLRGPQTIGEIRSRSGRLHAFEDLDAVSGTLKDLAEWGLLRQLRRLPGHKESRFAHLLSGDPESAPAEGTEPADAAPCGPSLAERTDLLETQVAALKDELAALKQAFADFRGQFE